MQPRGPMTSSWLWRAAVVGFVLFWTGIVWSAATVSAVEQPLAKPPLHTFHPSRVLVKFKQDVAPQHLAQTLQRQGLVKMQTLPRSRMAVLQLALSKTSVAHMVDTLRKSGTVEFAEPDYLQHAALTFPNDSLFNQLWGLHNTGQNGGITDVDIDAPHTWDQATGNDLVIGIIDTGVDYTHEDLAANMWHNPGEIPGNNIDDDGNGYVDDIHGIDCANDDSDPFDDNIPGHGTHVAGTLGAVGNNARGVVGVNWNTAIMALKFLDDTGAGFTSDAVECLEYAIMMKTRYGVDIRLTNNSWGGAGFSQALYEAIQAADAAGILFVAAAGNNGDDNDVIPQYPASFDLPNIISVAAIDRRNHIATFSNFGTTSVDLAAPGVSILSTMPGQAYGLLSGTSMATPHVTGSAALLWAVQPAFDPYDVKEALLSTVEPLDSLLGLVVAGGTLNLNQAINCDPFTVQLVLSLAPGFSLDANVAHVVTAKLSACSLLRGATITAVASGDGTSLTWRDDGIAPDRTANDGLYTTEWLPRRLGSVTLTVRAVHEGLNYDITVAGAIEPFRGYLYDETVAFNWIDVSQTGHPVILGDDDYRRIPLPFALTFYDQSYDHLIVGSNGLVYFEDTPPPYLNAALPFRESAPSAFIAALWDDLNPAAGGQIYWEMQGQAPNRRVIVQFDNVPHYENVGEVSFEVVVYENTSRILVQYLDVDLQGPEFTQGASATIGIQRDSGFAQQYGFNEPVLRNEMALVAYQLQANRSLQHRDIGAVNLPGEYTYDPAAATHTISASGRDIRGRRDAFHYVYRMLEGDGEIIARVNHIERTSPWAKAGVMMRAELERSAQNAMMALTPNRGAIFQFRRHAAGKTTMRRHWRPTAPYWVKLVRRGNRFKGYRSEDGEHWRLVGARTIRMPQRIYVGMVVTARNNARLCTAEFGEVRIHGTSDLSMVSLDALTGQTTALRASGRGTS